MLKNCVTSSFLRVRIYPNSSGPIQSNAFLRFTGFRFKLLNHLTIDSPVTLLTKESGESLVSFVIKLVLSFNQISNT